MIWSPEQPIKLLPEFIRGFYIEEAFNLHCDLLYNKPKIVLIEPEISRFEDHRIRGVEEMNPEWYKNLYHQHSSIATYIHSKTNRQRTYLYSKIRRRRSLASLIKIQEQRDNPDQFVDNVFRELIHKRLTEGFETEWGFADSNLEVINCHLEMAGLYDESARESVGDFHQYATL